MLPFLLLTCLGHMTGYGVVDAQASVVNTLNGFCRPIDPPAVVAETFRGCPQPGKIGEPVLMRPLPPDVLLQIQGARVGSVTNATNEDGDITPMVQWSVTAPEAKACVSYWRYWLGGWTPAVCCVRSPTQAGPQMAGKVRR